MNVDLTAEKLRTDLKRPRWGLAGRLVFGTACAALLALAALSLGVFEIPRTCVLPPGQLQAEQGFLYKYHDSLPAGDDVTTGNCALPLVLYEDGRPLGPPHSEHAVIRREGRGHFSHWGRAVYFSASDNSDPRTNGRTYTVRFPWQVPIWLWILVGILAAGSLRLMRPWPRPSAARCLCQPVSWLMERLESLGPAQAGGLVLLLAGVFRLVMAARLWHGDVDGHMVKGLPFSDGNGWFTLSQEFALGERWDEMWGLWSALRPFYYIFMGSILALTGPSLAVVKGVHLALSLLSVGLVYDLLRRLMSVPCALVAAIFLAFSFQDALYALPTTTETVCNFLNVLALWFFVRGWERDSTAAPGSETDSAGRGVHPLPLGGGCPGGTGEGNLAPLIPDSHQNERCVPHQNERCVPLCSSRPSPSTGEGEQPSRRKCPAPEEPLPSPATAGRAWWRRNGAYLLSGICLGLANLTESLTLPAVVFLPCLLGWTWVRRDGWRRGARRAAGAGLCLALGLLLALGPWLVRQYVVHGVWALSDNSASLLYAATSPEFGAWTPEAEARGAACRSVSERMAYFGALTRENVALHPGFYVRNVATHLAQVMRTLEPPGWLLALAFLISAANLLRACPPERVLRFCLVTAGFGILLFLLPPGERHALWLLGFALALILTDSAALLGGLLAAGVTTLGLVALSRDPRLSYAFEWSACALSVWMIWRGMAWACGVQSVSPAASPRPQDGGPWGRRVAWAAGLALAVWCAGLALAIYRNVTGPRVPPQAAVVMGAERDACLAEALNGGPYAECAFLRPRLEVRHAWHRDGVAAHFAPGEVRPHWAEIFKPRPYGFTAFTCRSGDIEYASFAGELPGLRTDLTLVGVSLPYPNRQTWFEVLAVTAGTGEAAGRTWARVPPEVVPVQSAWLREKLAAGPAKPAP